MGKPAIGATTSKNNQITTNSNNKNSNNGGAKTTTPCCSKVGIKRGPWTAEEDELLANFIKREGEGRWRTLPSRAGLLRCGKSCRLRWMNYLRPSVKRGHIAPDEEDLILRLHRLLGNRWSLIAGRIPGRTDNEIKNYWNTHLSKKLISQGIDPRTHKPLKPDHNSDTNNSSLSSKTNSRMLPNPNSNPNNNVQTQTQTPTPTPTVGKDQADPKIGSTSGGTQVSNKEKSYNYVDVGDQYQSVGQLVPDFQYGYENLPSSDGLRSSTTNNSFVLDEDIVDDMNYCADDDVFSSFLNSLINDDAFSASQLHPNGSAPFPTAAFGGSAKTTSDGWESTIPSCTDFNENIDSQKVDDLVE